ncbi:hypothetical protein [Paenibacillus sp. MBLB4367]|uniref:hypothetical protein n=1 Tax=Paenibacillus sp. MBLB4367 TaxID=3384767 RepID=UPI003908205C
MLTLSFANLSFDKDLQIIHADVRFEIEGSVLVEEPVCVDVGLPALLLSALEDTEPNRWAPADEWMRMPFFVCGCGDPECRGFSFAAKHTDGGRLDIREVDERQGDEYRTLDHFVVDARAYREQVLKAGRTFLDFVAELDYRPYFADTVAVVRELVKRLEAAQAA